MKNLTQNLILTLNPHRFCLFLLKDFHKSSLSFKGFKVEFSCQITPLQITTIKNLKLPSNENKILTLKLILNLNWIRFCLFLLKASLNPRLFFFLI